MICGFLPSALYIAVWQKCIPAFDTTSLNRGGKRMDLRLFPLPLPLPPGSAKRSEERGKRSRGHTMTTPKAPPKPPNAGQHPLCSPSPQRTRHKLSSLLRTVSPDPRACPNLPKRAGFGHPGAFLFHRCGGDFSFGKTKEKWGPHPRAAKRRTPPSPPRGRALPIP